MNESWAEYCRREQAALGPYRLIKSTLLTALAADQTHSQQDRHTPPPPAALPPPSATTPTRLVTPRAAEAPVQPVELAPCVAPTVATAAGPASEGPLPLEPFPLPELVFDFFLASLSEPDRNQLRRQLARLPQILAQRVLDGYNSAVGRKVQFRNKWGWLKYLIRASLDGRFIPTSG